MCMRNICCAVGAYFFCTHTLYSLFHAASMFFIGAIDVLE